MQPRVPMDKYEHIQFHSGMDTQTECACIFLSAWTKHLLRCPCDMCVHVTAFLIVFKSGNTEVQCGYIVNVTCAQLAKLCCEGFKENGRQWYQMQYVSCTLHYKL